MGDRPVWLDQWIGKLLRPKQALPVNAAERSRSQQHGRLLLMIFVFLVVLSALFGFAMFGSDLRSVSLGEKLKIAVGVPVGLAVLMYLFLYWVFVRGKADHQGHPWKFRATAQGLRVDCGAGQILDAPWSRWQYEAYTYMTVKMQRGITGIDISLDGKKIAIDLKRMNNGLALARAVVQQLAAKDTLKLQSARSASGSGAAG